MLETPEIKFKATARVVEEWRAYEEGSWVDHGCPDDHPYVLLGQFKTVVAFPLNRDQVMILSGLNAMDIAGDSPDMGWFVKAMARLTDQIEDAMPFKLACMPAFPMASKGGSDE